MADSSWDTYTPVAPQRRAGGRVLAALATAALLIILLGTFLFVLARGSRRRAWPLVRAVAAQLQTDAGSRELYRSSPALEGAYADEEAFLGRVRDVREGLRFPEAEPAPGPEYRVSSSPFYLRIRVKGEGEAWMDLGMAYGGPFSSHGIEALWLAKDGRVLRRFQREAGDLRRARAWARFAELAHRIATPEGLQALRQEAPALRSIPGEAVAFAEVAGRRREALLALRKEVAESTKFSLKMHSGPLGRWTEVSADLQDGGALRVRWKSELLEEIELR